MSPQIFSTLNSNQTKDRRVLGLGVQSLVLVMHQLQLQLHLDLQIVPAVPQIERELLEDKRQNKMNILGRYCWIIGLRIKVRYDPLKGCPQLQFWFKESVLWRINPQ